MRRLRCGGKPGESRRWPRSQSKVFDWRIRIHFTGFGYRRQYVWPALCEVTSMPDLPKPVAIPASDAPVRTRPSNYPEPFASRMAGREKRPLGDLFGLRNFGVNLTRLAPSAVSSLRHAHTRQDEFIYVLQGRPTLQTDEGRTQLSPGMCAGFKAGTGNAHRLLNETDRDVMYLEIGDRTAGDEGHYPDDDIQARLVEGRGGVPPQDGTPHSMSIAPL